ncbi:TPM domain-containing protein [Acinetobacter johnsonii]|uniref:TPM domain-containing protein n=1 Tax=Acinetobacter johnsonii TaxID=40214 RepID=UPI00244927C7|nr:TPM domain-containing protein [Acinetobacter johnsonii]MDH1362890.1 TPM domain-containing protein [Acinetobacter johnsonii]
MIGHQQFLRFSYKWVLAFILSGLLCLSSLTWAEVATATDGAEETVVAGKMIEGQQAASSNNVSSTNTDVVPQPPVANDMAESESIRVLPTLNEPVIDQAHILSAEDKQAIGQKIRALHDTGKAQIGIVIVPTTGQEDIFGFAMRIADQWQLGSAKQDNGLLIAIAVNDRRMQILTGYGLEGVIPDIIANRIINQQITPYFKQAQYAQGINAGLAEIERILNLDPEVAAQAAQQLQERQDQAIREQEAKEKTFSTALFILIAGIIGSFIFGKGLSASTAAVAGTVAGLVNGAGLVTSLLIGGGIFFLLITAIAQTIFHLFLASGGGRGGRGGGFGGGGGFSGGGGGFGGGGASGSW